MTSFIALLLFGIVSLLAPCIVIADQEPNKVFADEYCNELPLDKKTIPLDGVSIRGTFEKLDGFLVSDGEVITGLNYCQAQYACAQLGAQLPTARQLAVEAIKNKATLKELPLPDEELNVLDIIFAIDNDGEDEFSYNTENYIKPAGDLGIYWVWSSSHSFVYGIGISQDGKDGKIQNTLLEGRGKLGAVRCLKSVAGIR